MKKKSIFIALLVVLVLFLMFFPFYHGTYEDGGTRDYQAMTYRIIVWNRLLSHHGKYHKTSVYWFADTFKPIEELWEIERARSN